MAILVERFSKMNWKKKDEALGQLKSFKILALYNAYLVTWRKGRFITWEGGGSIARRYRGLVRWGEGRKDSHPLVLLVFILNCLHLPVTTIHLPRGFSLW